MQRTVENLTDNINQKSFLRSGVALLAGLAIVAPGSGAATPDNPPVARDAAKHPMLVFDDLGGGYPDVFVYPSVKTKDIGKWPEHYAFADGDRVPALCKKLGRLVKSHPEDGERERKSYWWVRIDGIPTGVTEYATATYIERPKTLLRKLHTCVDAKKRAA